MVYGCFDCFRMGTKCDRHVLREPMPEGQDDDYTEIGNAAVQEIKARLKPHIDLSNYFFELPDPDRDDLVGYQVVISYHGPGADDAEVSEAALVKVTADMPLGMAGFELTRSASTDVPLLAICLLD